MFSQQKNAPVRFSAFRLSAQRAFISVSRSLRHRKTRVPASPFRRFPAGDS
jgi:hypothetical protein